MTTRASRRPARKRRWTFRPGDRGAPVLVRCVGRLPGARVVRHLRPRRPGVPHVVSVEAPAGREFQVLVLARFAMGADGDFSEKPLSFRGPAADI